MKLYKPLGVIHAHNTHTGTHMYYVQINAYIHILQTAGTLI